MGVTSCWILGNDATPSIAFQNIGLISNRNLRDEYETAQLSRDRPARRSSCASRLRDHVSQPFGQRGRRRRCCSERPTNGAKRSRGEPLVLYTKEFTGGLLPNSRRRYHAVWGNTS